MAYIQSNKNQNWLLPLSIKDLIPKQHICFLVENFVESLNFSKFDMIYEGVGHPAYHPRIILKILIQGMISKVRSSRKLARASYENFVFMYLAEKIKPNFRTIARFRKENSQFIKDCFKKTVQLASEYDLVDLSLVLIDGSTLKANASKKRSVKKDALDILDKAIDKMIEEDIALDELEDQLFDDRPENITGMDEKDIKRIVREYNDKNKEESKKKLKTARKELKNNKLKKVSLTDPEARIMQNKKGFSELAYNAQVSVDSKNQIIVANDICQDGHDANQFKPQIKNIKDNIKLKEYTKVGVDCGYSSGENIKFAEDENLDLYVPNRSQAQVFNGKEGTLNHDNYGYDWENNEIIDDGIRLQYHGYYIRQNNRKKILVYKTKDWRVRKQVPEFFRERLRMKEKMETEEAKQVYNQRQSTVEPAIGNIKENFGFRGFLLRGLDKVKTEFNLVCIAHNLQKIWRLSEAAILA